ncbi:guanine nucleotide-binding protein subunit beta-like protein [Vigna radiata var. radiata]|uniref:Guanine nucleotide-binding protein subunit beta-like protein n=1 Tax=Vigna radiata var. radiata TaxID=3916 RepID=A0A1S3T9U3_VIGRR|nr:guanine nucleotide-binding protein subunit beta-like protein [Vigna radiata var. radiata]
MSSSSNELILTSSPDGPIMVYETVSRAAVTRFSSSRSPCRGLTMVGRRLLAASHVSSDTGAGSINIYNWHGSSVFRNFPVPEPIAPLIATPDGAFLFGGGISGSVLSLSGSSGDVIRSIVVHSSPVSSLHLSNDGSLVISGSEDGTVVVVPSFKIVAEGSLEENVEDLILHKWKAHSDSVTALKSVMGTLVSCSLDRTCKFWNLENCGVLMQNVTLPCSVSGVAVDSSGSTFYAGGADGFVYNGPVNVEGRKLVGDDKGCKVRKWGQKHSGCIVSLALVKEERNVVSAAEDGSVWMWDVEKGEVVMVFGDELITISEMIVIKGNGGGFGVGKGNDVAVDEGNDGGSFTCSRLCEEEILRTMNQMTALEEVKDVVLQDRKKAIEMLESVIEMYERLLKLILKEATKAIEQEEEEDEEDKDDEHEEEHQNDDKKEGTSTFGPQCTQET